jgi:hypothetical protein
MLAAAWHRKQQGLQHCNCANCRLSFENRMQGLFTGGTCLKATAARFCNITNCQH